MTQFEGSGIASTGIVEKNIVLILCIVLLQRLDLLRDGVDVPGRSLRLVVFDKVPWPKPTILHKARRARFGKSYDDLLTRFRLKQAFGRLIRGPEDRL